MADLKPHSSRYWLSPRPGAAFDEKFADVCAVYRAPAAAEQGMQTVSIDEMSGIKALERGAQTFR